MLFAIIGRAFSETFFLIKDGRLSIFKRVGMPSSHGKKKALAKFGLVVSKGTKKALFCGKSVL